MCGAVRDCGSYIVDRVCNEMQIKLKIFSLNGESK